MAKHTVEIDGDRLKAYIRASGNTQRGFAKSLGLTWNKFAGYTRGIRSMPIVILDKVVKALNLDHDHLLASEAAREDFDLKKEMMESVIRQRLRVEMGDVSEAEFLESCKIVAPYLVSKVYASGGFDAVAFATALEAAKAAVARGEKPEDLSEAERQQLSL